MGDISGNGYGNAREEAVVVNLKEEDEHQQQQIEAIHINPNPLKKQNSLLSVSVPFLQKLMAEFVGTYFLVFTGCASVAVNIQNDNALTLPGIAIVWGLTVMVLIYSLGHISGAHFNPAITIAFASCRRFPLKQVPAYVISQVMGATLAAATLRLLLGLDHDVCSGKHDVFIGSSPVGSDLQAFVMEFIVTFYLMFITSGVATDNRAIGELAGLAIGATILLNVLIAA
ncbi:PREDICTED: aquaporin NIP1-1 isoform X3 [Camelina sativa]|nr:PREDICTED: aquaporin NIP1-1 isoform X3 [Camelina sativa]